MRRRARSRTSSATCGARPTRTTAWCSGSRTAKPLHPDAITSRLRRIARNLGLPWIKVHGLRHTYATLLLKAGVHPKVVQERLGHGSISITMDTYSHAIPSMQHEAADLGAALIDGPSAASALDEDQVPEPDDPEEEQP